MEDIALPSSLKRKSLVQRARRRRKLIKDVMEQVAAELSHLSGHDFEEFRAGVVSVLMQQLTCAGKCDPVHRTLVAVTGHDFAKERISPRLVQIEGRENVARKLIHYIIHPVSWRQSSG
jgi:hypothetical protein